MTNEESPLKNFELFVRMAFRGENDGQELGHEPFIPFVCHRIKAAENEGARIVVNMPPRHLKTSVGTVFLSAWLLGKNPAEKIIIVTYSAQLANDISYRCAKFCDPVGTSDIFPHGLHAIAPA